MTSPQPSLLSPGSKGTVGRRFPRALGPSVREDRSPSPRPRWTAHLFVEVKQSVNQSHMPPSRVAPLAAECVSLALGKAADGGQGDKEELGGGGHI